MKKKILIVSIIVVILTLVSFSSVVGYSSVNSDLDISVEENTIPTELKVQRIRDLVQSIDLRKIIVNPDAVVDTLEEISSILEEEDVRNYIEKSSEEDCGCEDDSSGFEWMFPTICTLILPLVAVVTLLGMFFGPPFGEIMWHIATDLNCYWI